MGASGFFIVVTAFGLGVLVLESLGLLVSDGGNDGEAGGDQAANGDGSTDHYMHSDAGAYDGSTDPGIAVGARGRARGAGVFRALFALRMLVYFCCGFGPVGLASIIVGQTFAVAITAGVVAGIVIMAVAWGWIRMQRQELDSTIPERDLVGANASVLIAIAPGATGRVRITIAQTVIDRYAVAAGQVERTLGKGTNVEVVAIRGADVVVQPAVDSEDSADA